MLSVHTIKADETEIVSINARSSNFIGLTIHSSIQPAIQSGSVLIGAAVCTCFEPSPLP